MGAGQRPRERTARRGRRCGSAGAFSGRFSASEVAAAGSGSLLFIYLWGVCELCVAWAVVAAEREVWGRARVRGSVTGSIRRQAP